MVKTRSQAEKLGIKKEEDEEDRKPTLTLGNTSNTRNRITKRKPSKNKNSISPAPDIKVEEDTDIKSLLQSAPNHSKPQKRPIISQEQINRLIDAIVNDKMSITKAARKVNMCKETGSCYYNMYKNDPEKKIPAPREGRNPPTKFPTQEHIENLIRYISDDKMTIKEASAKANMTYGSGQYYYRKYLKDPNHNIPIRLHSNYTQDQKNEALGYIVNDKMYLKAASKKAKMSATTVGVYYRKYFNGQTPGITAPSHITSSKRHTQEQINQLISYIVDDKMTVAAASRKVNISDGSASKHYRQYLKDNNMECPVPESSKQYTQDEINRFIGYIVDDKMTLLAASKKAAMHYNIGRKYYDQYLKDNNIDQPARNFTQDQKDALIGYVFDDKMTVKAAAEKANIRYKTAHKYYRKYLKANSLRSPLLTYVAQDKKNEFISYIFNDKMSMLAASKKANIPYSFAKKYCHKYRNDHDLEVPTRYTQSQISQVIGYIVDDKMSIRKASKKANIHYDAGKKYYRQYLVKNNLDIPIPKSFTQEEVNALIGYIVDDKMSIAAAAKKTNMSHNTATKHYHRYLNNQKRGIPTRRPRADSALKSES